MTSPQARQPDGSWGNAQPVGWQGSGPDYEVSRVDGQYSWEAYDEDVLIGKGSARTRIGLALALRRHRKKWATG
jgi:hypothetical protein